MRDYVEYIGLDIHRGSKIICPFHNDNNPSMKVDSRYHCFACGEDGDVIDFVSRYFDITKTEAAKLIADEFGIPNFEHKRYQARNQPITEKINYRQVKNETLACLIRIEKELKQWIDEYKPRTEDEEPHFLFVAAIQNIDYVGYLIDELFACRTDEDIKDFMTTHKGEIII